MSPNLSSNISNLGTENAFVILGKAAELSQKGLDIINLGIGQPDFSTPKHIIDAAKKALDDGHHGYTPSNGIKDLRKAVCDDIFKTRKIKINSDNIVIVPGGKVTMWHAILMFGEPGIEIMYPNPGFPIYESVINYTGAKPVPVRLRGENNFNIDLDNFFSLITPKTRLIIINSPSNPTGAVFPKSDLDIIAKELEKHPNIAILSDEIYGKITYDNITFTSMLEYESLRERLIILDGWSKAYAMTGWRIGYGIWPKKWAYYAERLNTNSNSCTNTITQYAAIAALKGPQKCVDEMVKSFDKRRKLIINGLNEINGFNCPNSKGAFYAMPSIIETGLNSSDMEELLLYKLNIASVAGTSFGSYGEGYIRFSYANSEKNIEKAINKIMDYSNKIGW